MVPLVKPSSFIGGIAVLMKKELFGKDVGIFVKRFLRIWAAIKLVIDHIFPEDHKLAGHRTPRGFYALS